MNKQVLTIRHDVARDLYGPANDPQIIPQMIPGPELIPSQKVGNGVDSMKSLWMDTYFLNYPR